VKTPVYPVYDPPVGSQKRGPKFANEKGQRKTSDPKPNPNRGICPFKEIKGKGQNPRDHPGTLKTKPFAPRKPEKLPKGKRDPTNPREKKEELELPTQGLIVDHR